MSKTFDNQRPGFAIQLPGGDYLGVCRMQPPADPAPKLLIFTDRGAAENHLAGLAAEFSGGQVKQRPLSEWHRLGLANNAALIVRDGGSDYLVPPRVVWNFTDAPDVAVGAMAAA